MPNSLPRSPHRSRRRHAAAACLLIGAVLALFAARTPRLRFDQFDQPFYLGIAADLLDEGRFTDGYFFAPEPPGAARPSGMRFAPLYPTVLAAAALVDAPFRRGIACLVASRGADHACPQSAGLMRAGQLAALGAVFLAVFWLGLRLGGGLATGWIALVLALLTTPFLLRPAVTLMTEIPTLFLTTAATVAAIRALDRRPLLHAALAGMLFGAVVLTRPEWLALLPAVLPVLLIAGWRHSAARTPAIAFVLATSVVLAPWVVRNRVVLGEAGLTRGYAGHTLVQRIAFDSMTWREYGLAYVCWLPGGRALGGLAAGAGACDRFGWDEPTTFYTLGLRQMLPMTLAAAGGADHHLAYLVKTYLLRMPLWHLAVTVPLALRGAYVAKWWGVILLPLALGAAALSLTRRRPDLAMLVWPPLVMLGVHAAIAVNQPRYNLALVPADAVCAGLAISTLTERFRRMGEARQTRRSGRQEGPARV